VFVLSPVVVAQVGATWSSYLVSRGPAPPKGQGSQQGGNLAGAEGYGSQQDMAPVIPHGAGAQKGLRALGPEGHGSRCSLKGKESQRRRAVALQAYRVGTWQASCSFFRWWCGEAFHNLRV
jgi:hypothetical protein